MIPLTIVGIASLSAAWADSSPVGASPDEAAHVIYSWGVVTGQVTPWASVETTGQNGSILVDVDYPATFDDRPLEVCYAFDDSQVPCESTVEDAHRADPTSGFPTMHGVAHGTTYMARYPQLYYALTGAAEWAGIGLGLNGPQSILIARLVSGMMCLGLVAWSVSRLHRRFGPGPSVIVAMLALTPQFLSLVASVNPNGFEIAAAFALAAATVTVRDEAEADGLTVGSQVFLVVSSLSLAFARPASIVWACLMWLLLLLPLRRTRRPALFSLRVVTSVLVVVVALAGLGWFAYANLARGGGGSGQDLSQWTAKSPQLRLLLVVLHFGTMLENGFGLLGWADTALPTLLFVAWFALGILTFGLLLVGSRPRALRPRWAVAFLFASAAVVTVQSYMTAFGWQGRYFMPVIAATTVLLVPAMATSLASESLRARLGVLTVFVVTAVSFSALVLNLFRYAFGFVSTYVRFDDLPVPGAFGAWHPAGGLDAVALAGILGHGLVALAACALIMRAGGPDDLRQDRDPDPACHARHEPASPFTAFDGSELTSGPSPISNGPSGSSPDPEQTGGDQL